LELGHLAGLEMYGTASAHNHELVTALGAVAIDYRSEDFVERVRTLTGDGVDAVFDVVGGGRQLWRSYRALRKGGRLVPMGSVATAKVGAKSIPLGISVALALKLVPDGKAVRLSPNMMKYPQEHHDWYRETLADLLDYVAAGKLQPVIAARIPLLDAVEAHQLLERSGHAGKVVLVAR
jgi:NADPH:quinone reductase-like Zn-dependent oxidoreductase